MKQLLLIISCLFLLACEMPPTQEERWICNCQERTKVADFVTSNTKASNNMSDEEMEDVIYQLEKTGIHTYCHQELIWTNQDGSIDWSKNTLDKGETLMSKW